MTLTENTLQVFTSVTGRGAGDPTFQGWLQIREYEIETLGAIHPETGTFVDDDGSLCLDWECGEYGVSVTPTGTYVNDMDMSSFGNLKRELDWEGIKPVLDQVFRELNRA